MEHGRLNSCTLRHSKKWGDGRFDAGWCDSNSGARPRRPRNRRRGRLRQAWSLGFWRQRRRKTAGSRRNDALEGFGALDGRRSRAATILKMPVVLCTAHGLSVCPHDSCSSRSATAPRQPKRPADDARHDPRYRASVPGAHSRDVNGFFSGFDARRAAIGRRCTCVVGRDMQSGGVCHVYLKIQRTVQSQRSKSDGTTTENRKSTHCRPCEQPPVREKAAVEKWQQHSGRTTSDQWLARSCRTAHNRRKQKEGLLGEQAPVAEREEGR